LLSGSDTQTVDDRLIVVWHKDRNIHIWDAMESGYLQVVETNQPGARDLKISGDGSKAFLLTKRFIQVWFMWTGKTVGQVELEDDSCPNFLCMGGSRVCVYFPSSMTLGWDFGMSGPSPVLLPDTSLERPCLDFIGGAGWWYKGLFWIDDTSAGREVCQLSGRYARPNEVQ
jgi:hypothetical protein